MIKAAKWVDLMVSNLADMLGLIAADSMVSKTVEYSDATMAEKMAEKKVEMKELKRAEKRVEMKEHKRVVTKV